MVKDFKSTLTYQVYVAISAQPERKIQYDTLRDVCQHIQTKSFQMALWKLVQAGLVTTVTSNFSTKGNLLYWVVKPYNQQLIRKVDDDSRQRTKAKKAAQEQKPLTNPFVIKTDKLSVNGIQLIPHTTEATVNGWSLSYAKEVYEILKKTFN